MATAHQRKNEETRQRRAGKVRERMSLNGSKVSSKSMHESPRIAETTACGHCERIERRITGYTNCSLQARGAMVSHAIRSSDTPQRYAAAIRRSYTRGGGGSTGGMRFVRISCGSAMTPVRREAIIGARSASVTVAMTTHEPTRWQWHDVPVCSHVDVPCGMLECVS
jgi:hypothetical protein